MFTIDLKKYAEDVGATHDFLDPAPQCALHTGGVRATFYQTMEHTAEANRFETIFEIEKTVSIDGCLVRYGEFPPCRFDFDDSHHLIKRDNMVIQLKILA